MWYENMVCLYVNVVFSKLKEVFVVLKRFYKLVRHKEFLASNKVMFYMFKIKKRRLRK